MNKFYMIPNTKDVSIFNEELILPLENYSIGFDVYFNIEEINNISNKRNINVLINKFLHKKDINNIKKVIEKLKNVKYFFIEDLGLTNIIEKERIVINQNHIINNYRSINYFNNLNLKNIVVCNELTKEEIKEIRKNTTSELFYFLINRNTLMYSKRKLINSYYKYKNIESEELKKEIIENVSKKTLIIKEENEGTVIFDKNIFSANEFINDLNDFNLIINFSNMNENETNIILNHYKDINLKEFLNIDNYFTKNKIGYKVGDLK